MNKPLFDSIKLFALVLLLMLCTSSMLLSCQPQNDVTYRNPVIDYSLPDPTIIKANNGFYYLYATEDIRNIPIHRSTDLVNWQSVGTAFTDQTRPHFEPKGGCGLLILIISTGSMFFITPCLCGVESGRVE